jgi:hypothetical protein
MSLLRRLLYLGCLTAALSPFRQAQALSEPHTLVSSSSPGGWLGREKPKEVAWLAHDAMVTHDGAAVPDLLSLASRWEPLSPQTDSGSRLPPEQEEERDAMAVVLDALIQMHVAVPADTLRVLAPDFGNAVAVLLTRIPARDAGRISFDFYRSVADRSYGLQYVSASLLALNPLPGFAADLLANIKVRAKVVVVFPDSESLGEGWGGCCGFVADTPREGWPTFGQYALSTQWTEGAVLLVEGIDPIYAIRFESTHYLGERCGNVRLGPYQRLQLIAELLNVPPDGIPWKTYVETTIEFESLEQFNFALLGFVEEQQRMYRATAEALEARGVLTRSEVSQSQPQLELNLSDERGEKAEPISTNAINLPDRVEWSK